jgi:hypothetical protein
MFEQISCSRFEEFGCTLLFLLTFKYGVFLGYIGKQFYFVKFCQFPSPLPLVVHDKRKSSLLLELGLSKVFECFLNRNNVSC